MLPVPRVGRIGGPAVGAAALGFLAAAVGLRSLALRGGGGGIGGDSIGGDSIGGGIGGRGGRRARNKVRKTALVLGFGAGVTGLVDAAGRIVEGSGRRASRGHRNGKQAEADRAERRCGGGEAREAGVRPSENFCFSKTHYQKR
jgi:hypothetical protein